jgi:hypothetical protein
MNKFRFCEHFVRMQGQPISFAQRPYLPAIYAATGNVVLCCSRQVEKSTFLANSLLFEACLHPGIQMLLVTPRREQAVMFIKSRLLSVLEQSPLIRRRLLGSHGRRPSVPDIEFKNGSKLYVRAAYHSGDACRGISASLLGVDEFQDIAVGDLPVLQETLSHSPLRRMILTGTPKAIGNHLEAVFRSSTANDWTIGCANCGKGVTLDERCITLAGITCPACQAPLDPRAGTWVPRNPESTWGQGFRVNHLMVPWINFDEVLERQRTYDIPRFKNEVLGLPTTTGDCVLTDDELAACCDATPMARTLAGVPAMYRQHLVAGVDWGGGGKSRTLLSVGYMDCNFCFHVVRFERFARTEDPDYELNCVAERCRQFGVQWVAADGGGHGLTMNRLLYDRLRPRRLCAILYSSTDQEPRSEGVLMKWTVGRSGSLGNLIGRVKKGLVRFPQVDECRSFLDEFSCEVAEYDSINRSIKYTHPESQQDDALHATNYALLLGIHIYHARQRAG